MTELAVRLPRELVSLVKTYHDFLADLEFNCLVFFVVTLLHGRGCEGECVVGLLPRHVPDLVEVLTWKFGELVNSVEVILEAL
jgi:hypothetical protein